MENIEIIGYFAATLNVVAFIPQLIKILQTKSVRDVSFMMYAIMLVSSISWVIYGVDKGSYPLTISSSIIGMFIISIIILKVKYRNERQD